MTVRVMWLWVRALRNVLIYDFLFFVFFVLPAESFVSLDDSAVWVVIVPLFPGLFLSLFIMARVRAESPLSLFSEVIWGGISGITCQQLFNSIITNESFADGNIGDFYGYWPAAISLEFYDCPALIESASSGRQACPNWLDFLSLFRVSVFCKGHPVGLVFTGQELRPSHSCSIFPDCGQEFLIETRLVAPAPSHFLILFRL